MELHAAQNLGRLCFVPTKVNLEVHQEIFDHLKVLSSMDLCNDDFVFQQDAASVHNSESTTK